VIVFGSKEICAMLQVEVVDVVEWFSLRELLKAFSVSISDLSKFSLQWANNLLKLTVRDLGGAFTAMLYIRLEQSFGSRIKDINIPLDHLKSRYDRLTFSFTIFSFADFVLIEFLRRYFSPEVLVDIFFPWNQLEHLNMDTILEFARDWREEKVNVDTITRAVYEFVYSKKLDVEKLCDYIKTITIWIPLGFLEGSIPESPEDTIDILCLLRVLNEISLCRAGYETFRRATGILIGELKNEASSIIKTILESLKGENRDDQLLGIIDGICDSYKYIDTSIIPLLVRKCEDLSNQEMRRKCFEATHKLQHSIGEV